jgi:biopolymer transport protein ExbD
MAASLNSGDHETPLSEINVTPLVDVMLVLLVIFIIVAPVFSQSIRVDLPKAIAEADSDPVVIDLTLDDEGQLFYQGTATGSAQLMTQLRTSKEESPELVVRIGADAETDYQSVAQLLSIVRASGITRLAFATQSPSSSQ